MCPWLQESLNARKRLGCCRARYKAPSDLFARPVRPVDQSLVGGASSLCSLPAEVLDRVVRCHKQGDLAALAVSAASCSLLEAFCRPLLNWSTCCRGCGTRLLRPKDLCRKSTTSDFEDGPGLRLKTSGALRFERGNLHCPACSRLLGRETQRDVHSESMLCESYLQHLDGEASEGFWPQPQAQLRCSGARGMKKACGQVLCTQSDVLSRRHCWQPPGGCLEEAWYINGFGPGAVVAGVVATMELAQGRMKICDVSCASCQAVLGWQFLEDLTQNFRNAHQVGRFGLVRSSIECTVNSLPAYFEHSPSADDSETELSGSEAAAAEVARLEEMTWLDTE